jgi:hypothetical protein
VNWSVADDALEHAVPLLNVREVRIGHVRQRPAAGALRRDDDHPFAALERQRAQQVGIDDGEQGGAETDTKRQTCDCGRTVIR